MVSVDVGIKRLCNWALKQDEGQEHCFFLQGVGTGRQGLWLEGCVCGGGGGVLEPLFAWPQLWALANRNKFNSNNACIMLNVM